MKPHHFCLLLACILPATLFPQAGVAIQRACGPAEELSMLAPSSLAHSDASSNTMAKIVFIEDFRGNRPGHKCFGCNGTDVALGMDGKWVAITKGFSHSTFFVESGTHHFCAHMQKGKDAFPMFLKLEALAGKTYYLVAIPQYEFDYYVERFYSDDPDEGGFLAASSVSSSEKK